MLEVSYSKIEWHLGHCKTKTDASPCLEFSPRKLIGTPHYAACSVHRCMYFLNISKDAILFPFRVHDGIGIIIFIAYLTCIM